MSPPTNRIIVHVILPSGTRFEHTWSNRDSFGNPRPIPSDDKILRAIMENKHYYGYNSTTKRVDESTGYPTAVEHSDKNSGFVIDHPDTIVAIVEKDQPITDNVREIRRLKGPPATPTTTPSTVPSETPSQPTTGGA